MPKALAEVLEMIYLVKKSGLHRTDATNIVAKRLGIYPQTVIDKYCRQLGKKATEIDILLRNENLSELQSLLKKKFQNYQDVIDHVFSMLK